MVEDTSPFLIIIDKIQLTLYFFTLI